MCFWTDDGQGDTDADVIRGGPNGDLSLTMARLNFAVYGACHPRYQELVRAPRPEELP
nr:CPCC family cysteine-rich protein [Micromonospora zingiberis]